MFNHTVQQQFSEIFNCSCNIKSALSIIIDLGIMEKLIPEFIKSKGQMQFDLYHKYTVDRHIIEVIHNLHMMESKCFQKEFPLAFNLMIHYPSKGLLYMAAFFMTLEKGLVLIIANLVHD